MNPSHLPQDEAFLAHLRSEHGLELSLSDLAEINAFWLDRSLHPKERLADGVADVPDVQDGPIALAAAAGALGFGAASIAGAGIVTAILIGASIAYQVAQSFRRPQQPDIEQEKTRRSFGIDSTAALVPLGGAVPLIYCDRSINPNGGVRTSGYLVNSRIDTVAGAQTLYQLYCLALGPIAEIDESATLIDDQSLDNFLDGDVQQFIRLGTQNQTAIAQFPHFSQAVTVSTNAFVGHDLRGEVKRSVVRRDQFAVDLGFIRNGNSPSENPTSFEKDDGITGLAVSREFIRVGENGFVQATTTDRDHNQVIGISRKQRPGNADTEIRFGFFLEEDRSWTIRESGVVRFTASIGYSIGDEFAIEYSSGSVIYRRNGNTVYTSAASPAHPAYLVVRLKDGTTSANGVRIDNLILAADTTTAIGRITPGSGTTTITLEDDDEIDLFNSSERYRAGGQDFQIVAKGSGTLTASVPLNLDPGNQIFAVWTATIESSKQVNQLDLNLVGQVYGRNEDGELVRHAIAFDLFIQKREQAGWRFLSRFAMGSKRAGTLRRSIKIKNLPKDYYNVELRPLTSIGSTNPNQVYKLDDDGVPHTWDTTVVYGANTVQIEAERTLITNAEAAEEISFENKVQVSSEQGAPVRITTVNEIVYSTQPFRYSGLVLAGVALKASDRITGSPRCSFLISRGKADVRRYLEAGTCTQTASAFQMSDISASFAVDALAGSTLRNLESGVEATIASNTANTITTAAAVGWSVGDRYLVYAIGCAAYFPDVYTDTLTNLNGGLGKIVDGDEFVDAPAIVRSRRFADARNYYWDGAILQEAPWREWAQREAASSLMHAAMIDGRFSLVPEEDDPPAMLFNASNIYGYRERWVRLADQAINQIVAVWTDGSDDFRATSSTYSTIAVNALQETVYEERLELESVTNKAQVAAVTALALKGRDIQDRTIQFNTGLQGMYLQPGGKVLLQHIISEYDEEHSGLVVIAGAFNAGNGGQVVVIDRPLPLDINDTSYKAAVMHRSTGVIEEGLAIAVFLDTDNVRKAQLYGLASPLERGDPIILGREIEERRQYRVSQIDPIGIQGYAITAVRWHVDILDQVGIVEREIDAG